MVASTPGTPASSIPVPVHVRSQLVVPINSPVSSNGAILAPALQSSVPIHDIHGPAPSPTSPETVFSPTSTVRGIDIEHVAVENDPRLWPRHQKYITLAVISFAAIAPTLAINIYNPSFHQISEQLHATSADISLSLSLFILVQGNAPLFWAAVSEIKGRKLVYIVSLSIFGIGSVIAALSRSISLLICMRVLQAAGSSSVLAIGGGTLADMYDPHQRGTVMGIYYSSPLLGPAIGPIIGGILTSAFDWRSTFWFLVIFAGISILSFFLFLKDTWRPERSVAYQNALKRITETKAASLQQNITPDIARTQSLDVEKASIGPSTNDYAFEPPASPSSFGHGWSHPGTPVKNSKNRLCSIFTFPSACVSAHDHQKPTNAPVLAVPLKLSMRDVDILGGPWQVVRQRSNIVILFASALLFGFQYGICYTCARTFAGAPYNYPPIIVGLILLSFGIGNVMGSLLGGRWSDRTLRKSREKNHGVTTPEMRLRSTLVVMGLLPPCVLAYAWMCQMKVHVAGPVVMLFFAGFSAIWIYSSTLTYIVDANTGRSSTAIATNSSFRGLAGFIAAEISAPLQDSVGDGGLYSIWAGLIVFLELLIVLVMIKGATWRREHERRTEQTQMRKEQTQT
ncbi:hypothetical protein BS47DRAFT_1339996 [Hydnum rufescens UP504]|uniref:Major facilitator superfamily (MFS) profile domain-containing protein n=1 Tax=Hydnum rufescens UP504 TaxID=1448309 RepID=A0A9P6B3Z0_9AGAM|nr:hypothetical protein BS47DRAFT_1339996 [Hydnum rufescens UP504]